MRLLIYLNRKLKRTHKKENKEILNPKQKCTKETIKRLSFHTHPLIKITQIMRLRITTLKL